MTLLKNLMVLSCLYFVLIALFLNFAPYLNSGEQQYIYLARSFLQGKTYFLTPPNQGTWMDTSPFNGHYYYAVPPLPVIFFIPFVFVFDIFGKVFFQGYLQFFLVIGVFLLVFKIARKLNYSKDDSLVLAFAFCFASTFLGVALWPWRSFFSHVLTVLFVFIAIWEYLNKKRPLVIGIIYALIAATRTTTVIGISFFVLSAVFQKRQLFNERIKQLFLLLFPIGLALIILGFYNYHNFGNFFDSGISRVLLPSFFNQVAAYGVFSIVHIPTNLYYFLLSAPVPVVKEASSYLLTFPFIKANELGMSIFVTSPYFLLLFLLRNRGVESKLLIIASIITAIPSLLFMNPGFRQFGYRYSLDFLPFLFFLLIKNYKLQYGNLSTKFKVLIILTAFFNLYLFATIFL